MTAEPTPLRFRQRGEGWHLDPRRNLLFKAAGLLVLVALLVAASGWLAAGHPLQALGLAVAGAALGVIPFDRTTRRLPARTVVLDGQPGLLVPTHPAKRSTVLALAVLGLMLLAGSVAAGVVGVRDGRVGGAIGGAVLAMFGLLLVVGAGGAARERQALERGLVLLPAGLVLRTGRRTPLLPWDEIAGFRDHWSRPGRKILWTEVTDQVDSWLSVQPVPGAGWPPDPLRARTGTPDPTIKVAAIAVDPVVVLAVLRLYLAHPELRAELATERAVHRVNDTARRGVLG
ncbi:hypothetical protein ASC77_16235 [Nocardioides sp. Root1257]|uniref:hypothetical protein n=1 Tax=unclassified Nocardioides TaxID=2615069 RepID=UPI0006FE506F|nr:MULTISPECIES: hypothetical protein [unclassified Nocardioides]KQW47952.1 hypothetical protein ASC77_16235 [Nocardioides sp. Root1257]KRC45204.1 hypothetical protein ASE24_17185 [Nocardioides sp. Root224]